MEKKLSDVEREVTSKDHDGNEVKVLVIRPTPQDYRDSQIAYNKTFREALDSGAFLRQKLNDFMVDQGIWNEKKQQKYEKFMSDIAEQEDLLKGGGIRLSRGKKVALKLKELRVNFRDLLAERNALDTNSVEGQADNARFAALVRLCVCDPVTRKAFFKTGDQASAESLMIDEKAYDAQADQPWVVEAAAELANMIYELDPSYDQNLTENLFLKEFKFVDKELEPINSDGHHVDEDGRLINKDGRFIAYRTDKGYKDRDPEKVYFVNKDGEEVNEEGVKLTLLKRKPFLDDDDKPIKESSTAKGDEDATESKSTKKKDRTTKADTKTT